MNKKNFIIVGLFMVSIFAISIPPTSTYAQGFGLDRFLNHKTRVQNQASLAAQRQENNLNRLKQRADKAIDNRINELKRLLIRIQNDFRLSSAEKASLSTEIQTNITGLTNLKTKIDADTDLTSLRNDIKEIATYKVYAVVVPQTRLLIVIDNLIALSTRLQGLTPKLQNLINNLNSQGKNVSAAQALLNDINSRLQTITNQLATDKTTVLGVNTTSGNPHATFVQVRQDLAGVRASFAQIRHDIGQMRIDFKGVIHNTTGGPTSAPSTTPLSPSPSTSL